MVLPETTNAANEVDIQYKVNNGSWRNHSVNGNYIDAGDQLTIKWSNNFNAIKCKTYESSRIVGFYVDGFTTSGTDTTLIEPAPGQTFRYTVECFKGSERHKGGLLILSLIHI